jgi:hypothetical protein
VDAVDASFTLNPVVSVVNAVALVVEFRILLTIAWSIAAISVPILIVAGGGYGLHLRDRAVIHHMPVRIQHLPLTRLRVRPRLTHQVTFPSITGFT